MIVSGRDGKTYLIVSNLSEKDIKHTAVWGSYSGAYSLGPYESRVESI